MYWPKGSWYLPCIFHMQQLGIPRRSLLPSLPELLQYKLSICYMSHFSVYHALFVPFTDYLFNFDATLVLICLFGFPCYLFWLVFLSCRLIPLSLLLSFSQNRRQSIFLNFIVNCVTINWCYKICKKFPRSFSSASWNTLYEISNVFKHFTSKFLLALWWLLPFEQIDPTFFSSSFFEWLAFHYIRR